ncbi:hypothetical protein IMSHALPRED_009393 [Imshaugia aleurites]|uniref:SET domain-containing protein n=1 Tax=Imshaugia aleurites TaxID=172621 RepID=A0A8H3IML3_9LECA|nr:hypothetical protein IMSHALPRED_009393 [Imshaugia aleurites]
MFAKTAIKAGIRILDDELLFSISDSTVDEGIEARITVSLEALPSEQQQEFQTLHCPDHPTWIPLVSRYLANCFELGSGASGIFLKASRINHSCRPNAFFSWNLLLHRMTIHAIVDIPAGEEVTVSYVFPFFALAHRRDVFRKHYGFECDCPVCCLELASAQRSDQRRHRIETINLAIQECDDAPSNNDEDELEMVLEFIELAKDDHLDGQFLAHMYSRARECYEDRGSKELALKYAEMEVETNMRLLGEDNEVTKESARDLEELKAVVALM